MRSAFAAVASAQDRTAAQLLRVLMRDAVRRWEESEEYGTWFREQVEAAVREADDPGVDRVSHEQARSSWRQQRAELERRAAPRDGRVVEAVTAGGRGGGWGRRAACR